jgi:outer membrane autotransporter protein
VARAGTVVAPGDGTAGKTLTVGDLTVQTDATIEIDAREESGTGLVADRLVSTGTATFGAQASGFGDSVIDVKFDAAAKIPALEGIRVVDAANGLVGRAPRVALDPASLPNGQNFTLDLEASNPLAAPGTFARPGEIIPGGTGSFGTVVLQAKSLDVLPQTINAQYLVINAPVVVPPLPPLLAPQQVPTLVQTTPTTLPYLAPALIKGPTANVTTPVTPTGSKTGITVKRHGVQVGGTLTPLPQTATGAPVSPNSIPIGTVNSVVVVEPPTDLGTTDFVSVTGTYAKVDQRNAPAGTTFRLSYAPHQVTVHTTPTNYGNLTPQGTKLTSTQSQVGNSLTQLLPEPHARPATDLQARVLGALYPLSLAQIPGALDSVAGEGTDPTFVTAMNSRQFQQAIEGRLQGYRGSAPTPGLATGTGTSTPGALSSDLPVNRHLWGIALGSFGSGDYLQDADLTTGGFVLGADGDLGNGLVAGAALGYVDTSIDPGPGGSADVASLEAAGYAHWTDGPWFATGLAGLGYHWLDIDRAVTVGDVRDIASSSPDGWGLFLAATAGRRFDFDRGVALEPMVGLRYDHVWRDGLIEDGTAFADRAVDGESLDAAQAFVGARAYTEVKLADGTRLWPELNAGYAREIGNTDIVTGATLVDAPGASFTVTTEGPGEDVGLVGVRLSGERTGGLAFFLDYHAELRSDYTANVVRAGVSVPF